MNPHRKLPRLAGVAALLGAALMLLAACSGSSGSTDKFFQYRSANTAGTIIPEPSRKPVFDLDGTLVTGSTKASVAAHKGTVVVVPYWASWCAPCKVEMPLLQNVAAGYGSKVAFLGVNFKDDRDSARSFLTSYKIQFPNLYDENGENVIKLGNSPPGPPFTMLVDKHGKVAAFYAGRYAEKDLTSAVDKLRAEA